MKRSVAYTVVLIIMIAAWEYFGQRYPTVRLMTSTPSHILTYFQTNWAALLEAFATTGMEAVIGLMIAFVLAIALVVLCMRYPKLFDALLPIMVTSQVTPMIVLAPFFVILMGIGISSKITLAAIMCFFPVFISSYQGFRTLKPSIHELGDVYNAGHWFRIRRIYLPLVMPQMMAGLRVSATLSVIAAIVVEFTAAQVGLGKNLFISAIRLEPDLMMSSLFLSILLGGILYGAIVLIEKRWGGWYLSATRAFNG
jgi:NitT/TauT family transport system permease protein